MYLHSLLADVPAREREAWVRKLQLQHLRRNELLLDVDDETDCVFCVASGLLRLAVPASDRSEVTTDFICKDDFFAGTGLNEASHPIDARLVAVLPSSVYRIPKPALLGMCHRHPSVAGRLIDIMLKRTSILRRQILRISSSSTEQLVQRTLHELTKLAPTDSGGYDKRITQSVIASFSGLSREKVNKTIRQMELRGLVHKDDCAVHIVDERGDRKSVV